MNFGGYAYTIPILRGDRTERIPRRVEISHILPFHRHLLLQVCLLATTYDLLRLIATYCDSKIGRHVFAEHMSSAGTPLDTVPKLESVSHPRLIPRKMMNEATVKKSKNVIIQLYKTKCHRLMQHNTAKTLNKTMLIRLDSTA